MTLSRRSTWILSGMGGLLIAACGLSAVQMTSAHRTAERAQSQQLAVAESLKKITALNSRPALASIDPEQSARLTQHIETVANEVGVEPNQIERVQSQSPRRIEGGPYLRQPTQVLLRQVTLTELMALLNDLDTTGQALQIDDLRLIAPHDQLVGDAWRAEFTVSYLVYEPVPAR